MKNTRLGKFKQGNSTEISPVDLGQALTTRQSPQGHGLAGNLNSGVAAAGDSAWAGGRLQRKHRSSRRIREQHCSQAMATTVAVFSGSAGRLGPTWAGPAGAARLGLANEFVGLPDQEVECLQPTGLLLSASINSGAISLDRANLQHTSSWRRQPRGII